MEIEERVPALAWKVKLFVSVAYACPVPVFT